MKKTLESYINPKIDIKAETLKAQRGDLSAKINVGICYLFGIKVVKDAALGLDYLTQVAHQNDAFGQYVLGAVYLQGKEVTQDLELGIKWLEKATDLDNLDASLLLMDYFKKVDSLAHFKYVNKSALLGDAHAQYLLGSDYAYGNFLDKDIELAIKWYSQAATQDHLDAQIQLGITYLRASEELRSPKKALFWLEKAAKANSAIAQYFLATILQEGDVGVPMNFTRALGLYKKAADNGHPVAQFWLAHFYETDPDNRNISLSIKYYELSAEGGLADAQSRLGRGYYDGDILERDYYYAVSWIRRACEQNDAPALYYYGLMYKNGHAVDKDEEKAKAYFDLAKENGYII